MTTKLYYTAPQDSIFDEVKARAIDLWKTMGDEPSYAEEKIACIKDIGNIEDNLMYIVAMFDSKNQSKLAETLTHESREAIRMRMIDGGNPEYSILNMVIYPEDIVNVSENGNVRWDGKGYGFKKIDGTYALIRCPACGKENYALNVLSGKCTWCPFDANK